MIAVGAEEQARSGGGNLAQMRLSAATVGL
jgi:hypothetical protein